MPARGLGDFFGVGGSMRGQKPVVITAPRSSSVLEQALAKAQLAREGYAPPDRPSVAPKAPMTKREMLWDVLHGAGQLMGNPVTDATDAYDEFNQGNYKTSALAALGVIPLVGKGTRAVRGLAKTTHTLRRVKVGDGVAYKIMDGKEMVGHLSGFEKADGSFHLYKTEITDATKRGSGLYQQAVQTVADQYPNGMFVEDFQSSPALKKALSKMPTSSHADEKIVIASMTRPAAPQSSVAAVNTAAKANVSQAIPNMRGLDAPPAFAPRRAPAPAGAGRLAKAFETATATPSAGGDLSALLAKAEAVSSQTAGARASRGRILDSSTGQVFDESRLGQSHIPSYVTADLAPRKYPERADLSMLAQVEKNAKRFDRNVDRGLIEHPESAGWYDLSEMRKGFKDVSPTGVEDFNQLAKFMGPPSAGTNVPMNARQASYYYYLWKNGLLTPEALASGTMDFPAGYAHRRQSGVNAGLRDILSKGDLDPITQPKTYRYTGAMQGRWGGIPLDLHVGRQIGVEGMMKNAKTGELVSATGYPTPSYNTSRLVDTSPTQSHYPVIEDFLIRQADRKGILPAPYMSAGWVGGGAKTGVEDMRSLMSIFNEKFSNTGQRLGVSPVKAFEGWAKGQYPLY